MPRHIFALLMSLSLGLAQQAAPSAKVGIPDTVGTPVGPLNSGTDGIISGNQSAPAGYGGQNANGKSGEFVFAPIPFANQSLGVGAVPLAAYVFQADSTDKRSQPSTIGAVGLIASGGSWGIGGGGTINMRQDRFRTTIFSGYFDLQYDVFGVGNDAGNEGKSINVEQTIPVVFAQPLVGFWSGFYVGPRFIWAKTSSSFDLSEVLPPGLDPQDFQIPLTISSLGFNVQHDRRDVIFYPTRGHFLQATADYNARSVGSDRSFNRYQVGINKYIPFGDKHVLALRASGCGVTGSVIPFFAYCQFGQQGDNRGYQAGRYRDVAMLAMQAEWRSILWRKIGGTVFFGVGEVAPDGRSFSWDKVLPSGGLGLRYNLLKQGRLNLRADFAYSNTGFSWSMGLGEVF